MTGHVVRIYQCAGEWRMGCTCGHRSAWIADRAVVEERANAHSHVYSGQIQMTPVVVR